ncbi:hypothetical protein EYC80_007997 [Monilinia laxa]|uniref:Uncharacterized protein n=1 Tax=Monilinia laxa TaxID=61186 RepID=A0A5N6JTV6_MONLA|nr:hypothetical protein EYC80_007997 [Monilinia laxa]
MPRRMPPLLRNYRGPTADKLQPQSDLISPVSTGGPTLADELGDLGNEFQSSLDEDETSIEEYQTSNAHSARLQAKEAIAKHEKFLKDNDIRPRSPESRETSPPPLSEAQRRFPEKQDSGLSQNSSSSFQALTSPTQVFARLSQESPYYTRIPSYQSQTSPTPSQIPLPSSQASPTPSQMPLPSSKAPSRNKERERIVTPPPLSAGVFDTISREHGWNWLWWLLIPVILVTLAVYARYGSGGRHFPLAAENEIKTKATGAASKGKGWKHAEIVNSKSIIGITFAIDDIARILEDGDALKRLGDSPFNRAVLPIERLRMQVLDGEKNYQPLFWMIDKFVAKNREADHDWRSFLQQQTEATAGLAGMFDGYAKNAKSSVNKMNWMSAAHNITQEDFSDIPKKVQREGELLLCELLGGEGGSFCPTGPKLIDIYDDLKKSLEKPSIEFAPEIFETYSSKTTDIAKAIKSILKTWEKSTKNIETSKIQYKGEYGIGDKEKVVQRLNNTMKRLEKAMESPLVHREARPDFPTAIRKLEESRVRIKELQN